MSDEGEILSDNSPSGDEEGEITNGGKEEGEVSEEEESKSSSTCRFFRKGRCSWGERCRFLHLGVNDNDDYSMLERLPGDAYPVVSKAARAWERGMKLGKEMLKKSQKRRETDADFEEKRVNLKLAQVEIEAEDDFCVVKRNVEEDKVVVVNDEEDDDEKLRIFKENRAILRRIQIENTRLGYRSSSSSWMSSPCKSPPRVVRRAPPRKASLETRRRRIAPPIEERSSRRSPSPRRRRIRLAPPADMERVRSPTLKRQQQPGPVRNYRSKFQRHRDSSSSSSSSTASSRSRSRSPQRFRKSRRCNNQTRANRSSSSSSDSDSSSGSTGSSLDTSHIAKRKPEVKIKVEKPDLKPEAKQLKVKVTTADKKVFSKDLKKVVVKVEKDVESSELRPRPRREVIINQLRAVEKAIAIKKRWNTN